MGRGGINKGNESCSCLSLPSSFPVPPPQRCEGTRAACLLPALPGQLSRALPRGASLEKGEGGSAPTPRQEQRPGGGAEGSGMSSRGRETDRVPGCVPGSVEDSDGEGGIVSPFSSSSRWQKAP